MAATRIIAEIGVNHNGSLEIALELIEKCAIAGADIVKFQTFSAERLVSRDARKADYQIKQDGEGSQFEMLKRLELSDGDYRVLMQHCVDNGVEFLSTGFDEIDLDMLVKIGIDRIKIPSGEITNLPYLRAVTSYQLPVLMSTGMATVEEIELSIEALFDAGLHKDNLTILHCTSSYPAPDHELNLSAIGAMQRHFGLPVGYSDHSEGIEASVIAACLGATIIEKHVTLDRQLPGPDHLASIEPGELAKLASMIRRKDIMMGSALKEPSKSELDTARVARKSIVARQDIKKGDLLTKNNITAKRPGTGLSPMQWDNVIGTEAIRDFKEDETIILTMKND